MIVIKIRKILYLSALLAFMVATFAVQADVTELSASVDKNPLLLDESIVLSITAKGDAPRDAFDPSILSKDFVVGRTSVSSQTQMINFDTTRTTIWNTILIPRKEGRFTIPKFTVEGQSSQPINLTVLPVSASKNNAPRDVFVTTEVDMQQAYLQQQIKYTIKLHLARDLQRGSLSAPTLEGGEIRQIGKDAEYADIVDGNRYRIIERTFAVIPQKSGTFILHGPIFEGEVIEDRQQSFGFFNRSKTISRVGPDQEIDILPIPKDYTGAWLPSDYVELNEEWQPGKGKYRVGEPLTRTLTLTAVGVTQEQLPEIGSQYPANVKVYPDQADTTTVEKDNTLIAQRKETIAIIPAQAGPLLIPEISIPWFNILTKQVEYARLPARTIHISPAISPSPDTPPIVSPPVSTDFSRPVTAVQTDSGATGAVTTFWSTSSWILLAIWLLTLIAWAWQNRGKPAKTIAKMPTAGQTQKQAWKTLEQALTSGLQSKITPALTRWLQLHLHMPQANLPELQSQINRPELNDEINRMFAHCFGQPQDQWNAKSLHQQLQKIRAEKRTVDTSNADLQPLYPKSS